jgi:hypothetical protein
VSLSLIRGNKLLSSLCLKKATVPLLVITDLFLFLIFFSRIFEFIVCDHLQTKSLSAWFPQIQFHSNQFGYLYFIIPSVSTQGQTDSVYFDLTKAFDIVPHNILLRKLSNFGLSSSYVDWFHSYLSNRQSFVRISGTL